MKQEPTENLPRQWGKDGPEIRPNDGAKVCHEVVGEGFLHVEQMDDNCYWARLTTGIPGKDVVMWFRARGRIKLEAHFD